MAHDPARAGGPDRAGNGCSVGLVLGAGGIAGWAWMVGCLAALEEVAGWDARRADLIVGTSAGAGVAATLRGGRSAMEQLARYRHGVRDPSVATPPTSSAGVHAGTPPAPAAGSAAEPQPGSSPATAQPGSSPATAQPGSSPAGTPETDPAVPPLARRLASGTHPDAGPAAAPGSDRSAPAPTPAGGGRPWPQAPQLALLAFTRWPPRPGLALAGLLPRGRHSLHDLGDRLTGLHGHAWPSDPLWITAVRADTGRRVVFGRDAGETVGVATAVLASAAVPGWYEPIRIGDHAHLDGGSWSATNADLLAGLGFDVALILAPMSVATAKLGRSRDRLRRAYHRSLLSREADVVHRNGTDAVVLEPHPDDLALLAGPPEALDGARRLAIAERARQRVVERLAEDPSLAAAVRPHPEPQPGGTP